MHNEIECQLSKIIKSYLSLPVRYIKLDWALMSDSDLYLARLITSKQIIQPYVDKFFNSILLTEPDSSVPPPIKFLFDFLDKDAIQSLNKNATLTSVIISNSE